MTTSIHSNYSKPPLSYQKVEEGLIKTSEALVKLAIIENQMTEARKVMGENNQVIEQEKENLLRIEKDTQKKLSEIRSIGSELVKSGQEGLKRVAEKEKNLLVTVFCKSLGLKPFPVEEKTKIQKIYDDFCEKYFTIDEIKQKPVLVSIDSFVTFMGVKKITTCNLSGFTGGVCAEKIAEYLKTSLADSTCKIKLLYLSKNLTDDEKILFNEYTEDKKNDKITVKFV